MQADSVPFRPNTNVRVAYKIFSPKLLNVAFIQLLRRNKNTAATIATGNDDAQISRAEPVAWPNTVDATHYREIILLSYYHQSTACPGA